MHIGLGKLVERWCGTMFREKIVLWLYSAQEPGLPGSLLSYRKYRVTVKC